MQDALIAASPCTSGLYAVFEGLALHGIVLAITYGNVEIFAEDGLIEWIQFSVMLAAGGLFWWNWRRTGGNSSALLLCSMLSVIAALRELDHYSEFLLFEDAYKYPVGLIAFSAICILWQHRRMLGREIAQFSQQPALFFLAFGSFLTAIVAQVLGQAELWHALLEGPGAPTVKRVVEESLETLGYMILFLWRRRGVFLRFHEKRRAKDFGRQIFV